MSKIVFFCIPAHGHTNPTLGVVKELIAQGHQVWYYSYNALREKIESTGATFVACDDYDAEQKLSPKEGTRVGKDIAFSIKLLVDTTLALDDKILPDVRQLKPDCIVADSMALWGKAIAMKLGIPFVSSTTTFAFNRYSARIMKQGIGEMLNLVFAMPKLSKQVKRLQSKGYPVKSFLDIIQNDENTDTIVYTSPQFQPCAETFSDKYAFVGPSVRLASERIDKKRNKLIYISMGTVNNDMLPLYKRCISALENTEYQVILSVGTLVDIGKLGELPEHIAVYPQVDQIAVLQQADVFVSHCGMNSVSESLYYGVPLVMLPQTSEQRGVAERVLQLGAGVKLTKTDKISLRNAVETILSDNTYQQNAAAIGEGFHQCSGAKGAAEKILQVCGNAK